jgi:hypothetical protein
MFGSLLFTFLKIATISPEQEITKIKKILRATAASVDLLLLEFRAWLLK